MIFAGIELYQADQFNVKLEGDEKSSTDLLFAGGFLITLSWVSNSYLHSLFSKTQKCVQWKFLIINFVYTARFYTAK